MDGTLAGFDPELPLLTAIATVSHNYGAWKGGLPGRLPDLRYAPEDP